MTLPVVVASFFFFGCVVDNAFPAGRHHRLDRLALPLVTIVRAVEFESRRFTEVAEGQTPVGATTNARHARE